MSLLAICLRQPELCDTLSQKPERKEGEETKESRKQMVLAFVGVQQRRGVPGSLVRTASLTHRQPCS